MKEIQGFLILAINMGKTAYELFVFVDLKSGSTNVQTRAAVLR